MRRALWVLVLLCGPACALTLEGRSRVHAVVGQPLSVVLPLSFASAPVGGVEVQVSPAPGLAEAEEAVAESVRAVYDPAQATIRLSTAQRVVVPAVRLHLVITSGSFVVQHDFDVLVDLPDFNKQFERGAADAAGATAPQDASAGDGIRVVAMGKEQPAAVAFGDAAARSAAGAVAAERPAPTPAPVPKTAVRRPAIYAVHPGDTLSAIASRLGKTYAVPAAPLTLALYEANPQAFPAAAPEHPIAGTRLLVPEPVVVDSEPPDRVAAFKRYLRHPLGDWKPPSFVSFGEASLARPYGNNAVARAAFFGSIATVLGVAALLLAAAALARQLRPRLGLRPQLGQRLLSAWRAARRRSDRLPSHLPDSAADAGVEREIRRLRRMLKERPWRSDLRFQLVQRLYKARDARSFGDIAPPLQAALNEEAWHRVRAMGQELLPGDARFAG